VCPISFSIKISHGQAAVKILYQYHMVMKKIKNKIGPNLVHRGLAIVGKLLLCTYSLLTGHIEMTTILPTTINYR